MSKKPIKVRGSSTMQPFSIQNSKAKTSHAEVPYGRTNCVSSSHASNSHQELGVGKSLHVKFKSMYKGNNMDSLGQTSQARNISASAHTDSSVKKPAVLSANRPPASPGQTFIETLGPQEVLQDRNINKQQLSMPETIEENCLQPQKIAIELDSNQYILNHISAMKATESQVTQKHQHFENVNAISPMSSGQVIDQYRIRPRSVKAQQFLEEQQYFPEKPPADQDNYKENLHNSDISQYHSFRGVPLPKEFNTVVLTDQDSSKIELIPSLGEKCNEIVPYESGRVGPKPSGILNDSTNDLISQQRQQVPVGLPETTDSRPGAHAQNEDCLVSVKPLRADEGANTTKNRCKSLNEDVNCYDYSPASDEDVSHETCLDIVYDDSVFPSKHRLGTSEALNMAMMQARSRSNYRRSNNAGLTKYGVTFNGDGCYQRFPHTTKADLHLKYRKIMSTMNRQSYNHWKTEVSARAGQCQELGEEPYMTTYRSIEKSLPKQCPSRLQYNMSYIFGKPCVHQTLSKYRALKRSDDNESRIQKGSPSRGSCNRNDQLVENNEAGCVIDRSLEATFGSLHPNPDLRFKREGAAGRNLVKTGLLSGTVSESLDQTSRVNTAIKVYALSNDASRYSSDHEDAGDQKADSDSLESPTQVRPGSATSSRRTTEQIGDMIVLDSPKSTNWLMRKWEIKNLENSLKNCGKKKRILVSGVVNP